MNKSKKKKRPGYQRKPPPRSLSEMMAMPDPSQEEMEEMEEMLVEGLIPSPEPPEPPEPMSDTDLPPEVSFSPESPPDGDEDEVISEAEAIETGLKELGIELGIEPKPEEVALPKKEPGENLLCRDIRAYCTEHSIALILKALCEDVPEAMPNYRTWRCPDPIPIIHKKIHSPDYVEGLLSTLDIIMGSNIKNIQWTARVVIAIASYDVVRELGNNETT